MALELQRSLDLKPFPHQKPDFRANQLYFEMSESRVLVLAAVLVVVVWKYFGFHMMLFIAALQGLDQSQVEAARLDGATRAQVLRFVTLPSLLPTIRLSVFFAIVGSLQLFDVVMPLTGGGPEDSSQTLVTFLYNFGVTRMRVGFGSAVGVVLFVICASFAFGYQRLVLRDE